MNEKIKELAEQAEEYIELPMPDKVYRMGEGVFRKHKIFNTERFAELIVQECCQIVLECSIPGSNNERDFVVTAREIKQHFGVKE